MLKSFGNTSATCKWEWGAAVGTVTKEHLVQLFIFSLVRSSTPPLKCWYFIFRWKRWQVAGELRHSCSSSGKDRLWVDCFAQGGGKMDTWQHTSRFLFISNWSQVFYSIRSSSLTVSRSTLAASKLVLLHNLHDLCQLLKGFASLQTTNEPWQKHTRAKCHTAKQNVLALTWIITLIII